MQFKDECEPGFDCNWSHKSDVIIVTSVYTDTSPIRTFRSVPLVSVLERFDCNVN